VPELRVAPGGPLRLSEMTGIAQRHISEMQNARRPIGKKNEKIFAKALSQGCQLLLWK
jgi:hypothetical protein